MGVPVLLLGLLGVVKETINVSAHAEPLVFMHIYILLTHVMDLIEPLGIASQILTIAVGELTILDVLLIAVGHSLLV
jgi:hypothetical protein